MKPLRRESRSRTSTTGQAGLAPRTVTFECSAELLRDFQRRAFEQGCSIDWLLEEAMQRLLADEASEQRRSAPPVSAQHVKHTTTAATASITTPLPLPAPPDALLPTLPPPPVRATRSGTMSITRPPAPARVAVNAPLVLDYGGATVTIDRAPFVIGRSPNATDFLIDDGAVSRRHATIERTARGWIVTDLGSTNGIIVDGSAVRHAELRVGTVMTIGPVTFGVVSL